jgi:hypothetical protein
MIRQVMEFQSNAQDVAEYLMDNFDKEYARAVNEDHQMELPL